MVTIFQIEYCISNAFWPSLFMLDIRRFQATAFYFCVTVSFFNLLWQNLHRISFLQLHQVSRD